MVLCDSRRLPSDFAITEPKLTMKGQRYTATELERLQPSPFVPFNISTLPSPCCSLPIGHHSASCSIFRRIFSKDPPSKGLPSCHLTESPPRVQPTDTMSSPTEYQQALFRIWAAGTGFELDLQKSVKAEFARLALIRGWKGGDRNWNMHWFMCFGSDYGYGPHCEFVRVYGLPITDD